MTGDQRDLADQERVAVAPPQQVASVATDICSEPLDGGHAAAGR
jgi:hypothetical protein